MYPTLKAQLEAISKGENNYINNYAKQKVSDPSTTDEDKQGLQDWIEISKGIIARCQKDKLRIA